MNFINLVNIFCVFLVVLATSSCNSKIILSIDEDLFVSELMLTSDDGGDEILSEEIVVTRGAAFNMYSFVGNQHSKEKKLVSWELESGSALLAEDDTQKAVAITALTNGQVRVKARLNNSLSKSVVINFIDNQVSLKRLSLETFNGALDINASYVGDLNDNSVATAYLCNETNSTNCDPLSGNSFALNKAAPNFGETLINLSPTYNPGDLVRVRVVASDPDGEIVDTLESVVELSAQPSSYSIPSFDIESISFSQLYTNISDANNTIVNISDADDILKYCLIENDSTKPNSTASGSCGGQDWSTSMPVSLVMSGVEGDRDIYLWVADKFDSINTTTITDSIIVDNTIPGLVSNISLGAVNNDLSISPSLTWATDAIDLHSGIQKYQVRLLRNSDSVEIVAWTDFINGENFTGLSLAMDTQYDYEIRAIDNAGNIGNSTVASFVTASQIGDPTLSIQGSNSGSSVYVNLSDSQNVDLTIGNISDADKFCLVEDSSTKPSSVSNSSCNGGAWLSTAPVGHTFSLGDGSRSLYLWVANSFNVINLNPVSDSIIIDTSVPTSISGLSLTSVPTNLTESPIISWSSDSNDTTSGLSHYEVRLEKSSDNNTVVDWTAFTKGNRLSGLSLENFTNYRILIRSIDNAGNYSLTVSDTFTTNSTISTPTLELTALNSLSNDYVNIGDSYQVSLNISNNSDAVDYCISEGQTTRPSSTANGTCDGGNWQTITPTNYTFSAGEGSRELYLWVANSDDVISTVVASDAIFVDNIAPVNITGTTLGAVGTDLSVSPTVSWTTDGSDSGSGVEHTIFRLIRDSDSFEMVTWQELTNGSSFSGLSLAGSTTYSIEYKTVDQASNESSVESLTFTTPSMMGNPSILLSSPSTASTNFINGSDLGVANVVLGSIEDAVKFCLSQAQDSAPASTANGTCDGGNWSIAEPSSISLSAGDGNKTVYIWVANSGDEINPNVTSSSITRDDTGPTSVSGLSVGGVGATLTSTPVISWTTDSTDLTSGVSHYEARLILTSNSSVVSDWATFSNNSTIDSLSLSYNTEYTVEVRSHDNAGNIGTSSSVNFTTADTIADPTMSLSSADTSSTNFINFVDANTAQLLIGNDSDASLYCISEGQTTAPVSTSSGTCDGGDWSGTKPVSYTFSSTQGVRTLYIWVANSFGVINSGVISDTISNDTVSPTPISGLSLGAIPNTLTQSPDISWSGNGTDVTSGIAAHEVRLVRVSDSATIVDWVDIVNGDSLTSLSLDNNTQYSVQIRPRDNAGNKGSFENINFTTNATLVDPTLSLDASNTGSTDYVNSTDSNLVDVVIGNNSDVVKYCLSESNTTKPSSTVSGSCDGGDWSISVPTQFTFDATEGNRVLYLWVANSEDIINDGPVSNSIIVDRVIPTDLSGLSTGPVGASFSETPTINWVTNATDATSGLSHYEARVIELPNTSISSWQTILNGGSISGLSLSSDTNYRIEIRAHDLAGNIGNVLFTDFTSADTINDPSLDLSSGDTLSTAYLNISDSNTAQVLIGNDTDATSYCLSESNSTKPSSIANGTCDGGNWSSSAPTSKSLSIGEGTKTLYLWVANSYGVINNGPISDSIIVDNTVPTNISGMSLGTGTGNLTTTPTVSWTTDSTDGISGLSHYELRLVKDDDSTEVVSWLTFVKGNNLSGLSLDNMETYRFEVRSVDNSGNKTTVTSATFTTNSTITDPTFSITASNTSSTSYLNTTDSMQVNVSLSNISDAVKFCLSESDSTPPLSTNSGSCDGGDWLVSAPTNYTFSSGEGNRTIYAWVANSDDVINTGSVSDTIYIDTIAPSNISGTTLGAIPNNLSETPSLSWTGDGVDSGSGLASTSVRLVDSSDTEIVPWTSFTTGSNFTGLSLSGNSDYTYEYKTIDNAGNESIISSVQFTTISPIADPTLELFSSLTTSTVYININDSKVADLNLTNIDDATKYCLSETQSSKPASTNSGTCGGGDWLLSTPSTYTLSGGDGTKVVYIWVANATDEINNGVSSDSIILDETIPTTTSSLILGSVENRLDRTPIVNWTTNAIDDNGIDYYQSRIVKTSDSSTFQDWSNFTKNTHISGLSLENHTEYRVEIRAVDNAGNIGASVSSNFTTNVTIDDPTNFKLSSSGGNDFWLNATHSNTAVVSFTEPSGVDLYCLSETQSSKPVSTANGTCGGGNWQSLKPTSISLVASEGLHTAYLWIANSSGIINSNQVSASISIDNTSPVNVSSLSIGAVTEVYATPDFNWGTGPSDATSGVSEVQIKVTNSGSDVIAWTTATNGISLAFPSAEENTDYTIWARTIDVAGNISSSSGVSYTTPFFVKDISLSTTSISNMDVDTSGPGATHTVTVTNTGNIEFSGITSRLESDFMIFEIVSDNCDGVTVSVGGTCTIDVRANPYRNGAYSGTLYVAIENNEYSVALSGEATNMPDFYGPLAINNDQSDSSTSTVASPGQSYQYIHNVKDGPNRIIIVSATSDWMSTPNAKFNGTTMTLISSVSSGFGNKVRLFYTINPPVGDGVIEITGTNSTSGASQAYTFYNVDQSNPVSSVQSDTASNGSGQVTIPLLDHKVSVVAVGGSDRTASSDITPEIESHYTEGEYIGMFVYRGPSSISPTFSYGSSDDIAIASVVLNGLENSASLNSSPKTITDFDILTGSSYGPTHTITISNLGGAASSVIQSPVISGDDTFVEVVADNCVGNTIASGSSCTIDVRPKSFGNTSYGAHILFSDSNLETSTKILGEASGFEADINVKLDNSTTTTASYTSGSQSSFSHTVGDFNNRLLVVSLNQVSNSSINAVTFMGINLTQLDKQSFQPTSNYARSETWYLVNPPVGAGTINVTSSMSANTSIVARNFYSVDLDNPIELIEGKVDNTSPTSLDETLESSATDFMMFNLASNSSSISFSSNLIPVDSRFVSWNSQIGLTQLLFQKGGLNSYQFTPSSTASSIAYQAIRINSALNTTSLRISATSSFDLSGGNTSSTIQYSVRNNGGVTSSILNAATIDSGMSYYNIITDNCSGISLAAGESCILDVEASTVANGTLNGQISIDDGVFSSSRALSTVASGHANDLFPSYDDLNFTKANFSSSSTSYTQSHTIAAGNNRLLVVNVVGHFNILNFTSITYGGVPLTRLDTRTQSSGAKTEIWYLINPSVGTDDIVINVNNSSFDIAMMASNFTNVHQSTPFDLTTKGGGQSNLSVSVNNSEMQYSFISIGRGDNIDVIESHTPLARDFIETDNSDNGLTMLIYPDNFVENVDVDLDFDYGAYIKTSINSIYYP
ncbi:bacterial group 3 Ig-like protein [Bacteriovorax sp. BAL6_X]|uniref:beta strand repeat-containing protein n=1 Tax=Bacteriovorax sp. BAL6_X TaxID=1201290 RepID=UPI00038599FA|nr:Ig-like domain repeat protein [Bacteriovorax sp. BAL6_X]EPZ52078.1 bacterial group 3 Ig-like protein [Bacteriovorax sp. BAL6_X]